MACNDVESTWTKFFDTPLNQFLLIRFYVEYRIHPVASYL